MHARDPTAKQNLTKTKRTYRKHTRRNTPGDVPAIQRIPDHVPTNNVLPAQPRRSPRITQEEHTMPQVTFTPIPTGGRPK